MKQQRQTSKFKAQVVLELLKGETLEELSRKYAVAVSEINTWRDEFIQNGTDGFKRKPVCSDGAHQNSGEKRKICNLLKYCILQLISTCLTKP